MEFLEFLKEAQSYIPPEYAYVSRQIDLIMPYLILAISLLICYAGLKFHRFWIGVLFFMAGFFVGAISGVFFPETWSIYIFIGFGVVLGALLAYFSHKLYKVQLFIVNFLLVYSSLPLLLDLILPDWVSAIIGAVLGVAAGILAVKFKHIVVIATSAFCGAFNFVPLLTSMLRIRVSWLTWILAAVMAASGIAVQFMLEQRAHHRDVNKVTRT